MTAFGIFAVVLWIQWRVHRNAGTFYFDPQDAFRDPSVQATRSFPKSAENATFEPMLKSYVGVTQLLVTVAAASIAFGGNAAQTMLVFAAKVLLAWSIFYGVLFCALLLWRYDEYGQNVRSYTAGWYVMISALGFAGLICFMLGYLVWAVGLLSSFSDTQPYTGL